MMMVTMMMTMVYHHHDLRLRRDRRDAAEEH
jgi:hypothetical protein